MYIAEYFYGTYNNHQARRDRKLLLTKKELQKIQRLSKESGFSVIPTKIYISDKGLDIKSISYPNNKAKNLSGMARMLVSEFGGQVPSDIDQLQRLPGVGRKTANVVAIVAFHQSAMPVDTHVFRVSDRLGLTTGAKTPLQTEMQLTARIPAEDLPAAHHWLILHGRYVCTARKPHCEACGLKPWCRYFARSEAKSSRPQRQSQ